MNKKQVLYIFLFTIFTFGCTKTYYIDASSNLYIKKNRKYTVHNLLDVCSYEEDSLGYILFKNKFLIRADSINYTFLNVSIFNLKRLYYFDNPIEITRKKKYIKISHFVTDKYLDSSNFNSIYKDRFKKNIYYIPPQSTFFNFREYYWKEEHGQNKKNIKSILKNDSLNNLRQQNNKGKKIRIKDKDYFCRYNLTKYPSGIKDTNSLSSEIHYERDLQIYVYENEKSLFPLFSTRIFCEPLKKENQAIEYQVYQFSADFCLPLTLSKEDKKQLIKIEKLNSPYYSKYNDQFFDEKVNNQKINCLLDSLFKNDLNKIDSIENNGYINGIKKKSRFDSNDFRDEFAFYNVFSRDDLFSLVYKLGLEYEFYPFSYKVIFNYGPE